MRKITEISPQAKNPKRFNIFVDKEFFIGVNDTDLYDFGLKVGEEITPELEDALNANSQLLNCERKAFNLLAYRDRTSFELGKRLKEAGFDKKEIDLTIEKLEVLGYINNEKFIRNYIESEKNKGSSAMKIRSSLQNMGVPYGESQAFIEEIYSEDDQTLAAKELLVKKSQTLKNMDNYTKKQKLIAYLSRKGFDFHIIFSLIDDFIFQDDEK